MRRRVFGFNNDLCACLPAFLDLSYVLFLNSNLNSKMTKLSFHHSSNIGGDNNLLFIMYFTTAEKNNH